jgi:predicted alpha/beta-fold hydrolase
MFESRANTPHRHEEEITSQIPAIDVAKLKASKYLHEFDRHVQCPTWGWPTEGAYYRDASCIDAVMDVRVPLFAIHAKDDPVRLSTPLPIRTRHSNDDMALERRDERQERV